MTETTSPPDLWRESIANRFGAAVQRRRKELGLTASELARRTQELGSPLNRVAIAKIENGHRGGRLDLSEVAIIAAALDAAPVLLLFPFDDDGPNGVDVLPSTPVSTWDAIRWFTGEGALPGRTSPETTTLENLRERDRRVHRIDSVYGAMNHLPAGQARQALFTEMARMAADLSDFDQQIGYDPEFDA